MKALYYHCLALLICLSGCTDRSIIDRKEGVSLPTVSNLTLQQVDENHVRLNWEMPSAIPEEMQQPLNVYIDVEEILGPTRSVSVFNTILANAPTTYVYELPDPSKVYHLIVKVNGLTKNQDVNYSGNIYSLGQTVVYNGLN